MDPSGCFTHVVSILDSWDICCEYNAGAQEVIFTRYSCI